MTDREPDPASDFTTPAEPDLDFPTDAVDDDGEAAAIDPAATKTDDGGARR